MFTADLVGQKSFRYQVPQTAFQHPGTCPDLHPTWHLFWVQWSAYAKHTIAWLEGCRIFKDAPVLIPLVQKRQGHCVQAAWKTTQRSVWEPAPSRHAHYDFLQGQKNLPPTAAVCYRITKRYMPEVKSRVVKPRARWSEARDNVAGLMCDICRWIESRSPLCCQEL